MNDITTLDPASSKLYIKVSDSSIQPLYVMTKADNVYMPYENGTVDSNANTVKQEIDNLKTLTAVVTGPTISTEEGVDSTAGTAGIVPAPTVADAQNNKFLKATGVWTAISIADISDISAVYKFKGNVASYEALIAITDAMPGDVYNVGTDSDGKNYAWTGLSWDSLAGTIVDVSDMVGATSTTDGESGLVPQPLKSDINKVLSSDGTWTSNYMPLSGGVLTGTVTTKGVYTTVKELSGTEITVSSDDSTVFFIDVIDNTAIDIEEPETEGVSTSITLLISNENDKTVTWSADNIQWVSGTAPELSNEINIISMIYNNGYWYANEFIPSSKGTVKSVNGVEPDDDGDVTLSEFNHIILTSPNGTKFKITVADDGRLESEEVADEPTISKQVFTTENDMNVIVDTEDSNYRIIFKE